MKSFEPKTEFPNLCRYEVMPLNQRLGIIQNQLMKLNIHNNSIRLYNTFGSN